MQRFSRLFRELDQTNSTNRKVEAMVRYFADAPPADAAWGVFFLSGERIKRLVSPARLREWVAAESGYPAWLVEASYANVGDLAETIALLLDAPAKIAEPLSLAGWVEGRILPLRGLDEVDQEEAVRGWWRSVDADQRFLVNKLLTGALRVGVSRRLVTRALARHADQDPNVIAHRLMGDWTPSAESFDRLVAPGEVERVPSMPYPFFLASPLEGEPAALGSRDDWCVEWKWDGIRAQLIHRAGETHLWSRGEESMNGRFPEVEAGLDALPDGTVLDGELLAWREGPLPFAVMQKRIGRRKPGAKILETAPVSFLAYDVLEADGEDLRETSLAERRQRLAALIADLDHPRVELSTTVSAPDWETLATLREEARERGVEGFILKRWSAPYRVGRRRGDWWKWKVDPLTVDAVLIYAQAGHGRRSNLYTDYTLAVWADEETLVPVAKAYSGLDNEEIARLDRWIRRHTQERFGPVRSVEPHHVFEIAFEGINASTRHKAGLALRFPRIARWRQDLSIREADTLADLKRLLPADD
ncbi:MAG: ATP-dependent DNA ligase [Pseudomonadota bacterium]